jgi:hypothetical protein
MNRLSIIVLGLGALTASAVSYADIYKCADDTGQVAFADAKTKSGYNSCKLVMRDESASVQNSGSNQRATGMKLANYTRAASPADFPKVDRQTQNARDDKRKQILLSELESEQKALQDAKKIYVDNSLPVGNLSGNVGSVKLDDKMQRLLTELDSHEKNIQLIQKEIAALR